MQLRVFSLSGIYLVFEYLFVDFSIIISCRIVVFQVGRDILPEVNRLEKCFYETISVEKYFVFKKVKSIHIWILKSM